jgi:hypothetical protein
MRIDSNNEHSEKALASISESIEIGSNATELSHLDFEKAFRQIRLT